MVKLSSKSLQDRIYSLEQENEELRETLRAIQAGEIDALIVDNEDGKAIFTLAGAEQPYRELVEAMNEGAATLSEEGLIVYCNSKFATMTQLPLEKVIGTDAGIFLRRGGREALQTLLKNSSTNPSVGEMFMFGSEAAPIQVQLSISQVPIGHLRGYCVVVTDITERAQIEERLRQVNESLEQRVENRTQDLSTALNEMRKAQRETQLAKEEAERANETKSAFLANMSHEIRTPLGAILGFTDLLRERDLEIKERNHFLNTISRNGKALTRIIDDILDLAKVESGKLDIEKVEFSFLNLIDDVMDVFRERARSQGIFVRVQIGSDIPDKIVTDPSRLRQIFINIVGNAVKFTNEGGVTISVECARNGISLQFSVSVKDTGIGLSAEQKEKLFQPFVQADNSTTRKFGGTGLGLTLSKRLAMALGGNVTIAKFDDYEGCVFLVTFAAELAENVAKKLGFPEAKKYISEGKLSLRGIRVLVADDSADNLFLVERMLGKHGAVVEKASNGNEAFRKGMSGDYDLVLMDIQMPEMDGYAATRALRQSGFNRPIIALTAHAMAEERARTREAGCDGHLTKPLNQEELINMVSLMWQRPDKPLDK